MSIGKYTIMVDLPSVYSAQATSFLFYEAAISVSSYVYLSQIAMQWFDVGLVHVLEAGLMLHFYAPLRTWPIHVASRSDRVGFVIRSSFLD
jgi:hypothetical protein